MAQDLVAIGDGATPRRIVDRYAAAGIDDLLLLVAFGGMPHHRVLRSLEEMARHLLAA